MNSRRLTSGGVLGSIALGTSLLTGYLSVLAAQQPITEDSVPPRAVAVAGYYASGAEPDKRDPRSKFVDQVAAVIECVHEHYAVEIPHAQFLDWAVQQIYARLERIVPVKISERLDGTLRLDGKGLRELLGLVADDCKDELRRCTDLAFDGILRHLDERCEIYSGWSFRCILRVYNPVGIGVRLAREPATGRIQVSFPIRGSPAYLAGLRSGDVIEEIHRPPNPYEEAQTISPRGLALTRAYQELQGRPGDTVHLKVARPGVARILQFDVEHKRVREESVLGLRCDRKDDWEHWLDPARKIAYLRVTRLGPDMAQDFARMLDGLRRQGLKALVLDLRFSEGGLIYSGVRTTELLVGEAPISSLVFRGEVQDRFSGERGKEPLSCPIACLVNRHTSRMAEVVAAALQDNKRALIVGERTRGDAAIETYVGTSRRPNSPRRAGPE
jgi:carboxyl-terminal processing protease